MTIRTAVTDNGVGTITFADPPLNILTQSALAGLRDALAQLAEEGRARVVILAA